MDESSSWSGGHQPGDAAAQFSSRSLPGAVALWASLYLGLRALLKHDAEHTSRLVALLHALLVMCMGGYLCAAGLGPHLQVADYESMKKSHYTLFTISFGYFTYDLVFCLWQCKETMLMIIHHVYSVSSLLRILIRGQHGTSYACGLAAMELTNPLLQVRWFIRSAGHGNSFYFYIVEATFILVFILLRGFYGTYLWVQVLLMRDMDLESKAQATMMHFISLAFIYNILKYIRTKYLKKSSRELRNNIPPSITRTPLVTFSEVQIGTEPPRDTAAGEGEKEN